MSMYIYIYIIIYLFLQWGKPLLSQPTTWEKVCRCLQGTVVLTCDACIPLRCRSPRLGAIGKQTRHQEFVVRSDRILSSSLLQDAAPQ